MKRTLMALTLAVVLLALALPASTQQALYYTNGLAPANTSQPVTISGGTATVPGFQVSTGNVPQVQAGTSGVYGATCGVLFLDTTSVASASTSKSTLRAFSLPANVLSAAGKYIEVEAWGTAKATANNKTQTIDFGAAPVTVSSTGAVANNAGNWWVGAKVISTGTNAQSAIGTALSAATPAATFGTGTETQANALTIAITATNVTDTDGTTLKGALVKACN